MPGDSILINTRATIKNTYDAIVVGSGISGGWAAKELCEKGLKTLVLERGRDVVHIKDYTDTSKNLWELPHRGGITQEDRRINPIQTKVYAYNEVSKHFLVNDQNHPYIQKKPYIWIRGYQVGGRSLVWGRMCLRFSDLDFEANLKEGVGVDWPIRYKDLAPWYDYVEKFVGVSGNRDGIAHLPDGCFMPAMEMNCMEKEIAKRMQVVYNEERQLIIGRTANHTHKIGDRGPCQYRNKCEQGCPFGGYFSSNSATLPAAMKTGKLTLRPFSIVSEVLYDNEKKKAIGVRIIDTETLKTEEFYARVIFLNVSTINTAALLLRSVSDAFPEGLGNSSGHVGHNLMDHHKAVGATGKIEGFEDRYYHVRKPTGTYIPRFRNISKDTMHPDFIRGYGYQTSAARSGWSGRADQPELGSGLKDVLTEPGSWSFELAGFGETLPYFDNKVYLDRDKKDKWGLPLVGIDFEMKENEKKMRKDMAASAVEILEKLGGKEINSYDDANKPGERIFSIHDMGVARMGRNPKSSVLNGHNQMHDVKNVFITDGSCMASAGCQNPSLTYMALTARACDFAVQELKKGNL
ncbi:GMC oxidoreductase [Flavihumibacter profundi]|uniref:GMC oxidoreductase n=1 Tax=Flavihumibacter profundi TaxID=2716883 RepID=UPI001CC5B6D8|nr:GMC family oxidoreductase [Flavihumibacter profundi]MBZ5856667.1 GMC family oxidoreductase [Flavihumibacter profundi]